MRLQQMISIMLVVIAGSFWLLAVGRLDAQPAEPAPVQRIATVDMLLLVERSAMQPQHTDALQALADRASATMQGLLERQKALEEQARGLDQQGEVYKALESQYVSLREEMQRTQTSLQAEIDALTVKQLQEIHASLQATVAMLARERGYSHVLSSRQPSMRFRAEDIGNTLQEMIARSVVVSPDNDDLTQAMIDRLGLVVQPPSAPPAPPAP